MPRYSPAIQLPLQSVWRTMIRQMTGCFLLIYCCINHSDFITFAKTKLVIMKNLTLVLLASLTLWGCKDGDNDLDENYKMSVYGRSILTKGMADSVEIVLKNAYTVRWNPNDGTVPGFSLGTEEWYYDGGGCQRDFENRRFLFAGGWVIIPAYDNPAPSLGPLITTGNDVMFIGLRDTITGELFDIHYGDWASIPRRCIDDTLGYIPNAIMSSACARIIEAFNKKDYATCYAVFDSAFVFVPTTGSKWRALKEAGIE